MVQRAEERDRRQERILALLLMICGTLFALYFVLGTGPASLVWLTGRPPAWLPFAGAGLDWLPLTTRAAEPSPAPSAKAQGSGPPSPSPDPIPSASATPPPDALPGALVTP